jgi:hypothetical protein
VYPTRSCWITIDFTIAGRNSARETHHGECGAARGPGQYIGEKTPASNGNSASTDRAAESGRQPLAYWVGTARKPWVIEPGPGAVL